MELTYPQAIQDVQGADNKYFPAINSGLGIVLHSAEGYRTALLQEVQDPNVALSWHFSIDKQGNVYQHYTIDKSCWHGGNYFANTNYIGIEHEGIIGEPLTSEQFIASYNLVHWLADTLGIPIINRVTLHAHKDVWNMSVPNTGPTSCPNNRIPFDSYTEDDVEVTQLDQSDSIKFIQELVANVSDIVADANGCTVLELKTPRINVTPGYKLYGVIVKETQ